MVRLLKQFVRYVYSICLFLPLEMSSKERLPKHGKTKGCTGLQSVGVQVVGLVARQPPRNTLARERSCLGFRSFDEPPVQYGCSKNASKSAHKVGMLHSSVWCSNGNAGIPDSRQCRLFFASGFNMAFVSCVIDCCLVYLSRARRPGCLH